MKCPLRNTTTHYIGEEVGIDAFDCLQEECAWWSEQHGHCVILACQQTAEKLAKTLEEIEGKLSGRFDL